MRVKINGRLWDLVFTNLQTIDGDCAAPTDKGKRIRVASTLRGERRLDVLLHEMLHAGAWNLDESTVSTIASDMSRVLWRLGYRGPNEE